MASKGTGKRGAPPPPSRPRDSLGHGGYLAKAAARKKVETSNSAALEEADMEAGVEFGDPFVECPSSECFDVGDEAAIRYFNEYGYVVFRAVADAEQLNKAEELLFQFMDDHAGWKQGDPDSWSDEGLAKISANGIANGIINKCGAGQSDLNWYVRTLPMVHKVFEQVWQNDDLITSFDCFGVFRPWHSGKFFKTLGGWFHVDQASSGMQCVQGLLSIYDQDASTGGLTVIPGSHLRFEEHATPDPFEEYIPVHKEHPIWQGPHRLVQMHAGDFVIWDSRTVHCNSPAMQTPIAPQDRLLRAVVYVCMTPRERATAEILKQRIDAYNLSKTTTHWPHKYPNGFGFKRVPPLQYALAPPERKALI